MVSGAEIDSYLCINRQRRYGADVISRIQASVEGKRKNCRKASGRTFYRPGKAYQGRRNCTGKVVIAGNTTMIHLLMGYPSDTLGVYPFILIRFRGLKARWERSWERI